ncbi:hypothetical protein K8I61_15360 [bacterium]|nr:hypothetical protein [bacterium]
MSVHDATMRGTHRFGEWCRTLRGTHRFGEWRGTVRGTRRCGEWCGAARAGVPAFRSFLLSVFILVIATALFPAGAFAASIYEAGYDWKTIATENFEIIYYEGEEFLAKKAAIVAEDVFPALTQKLRWVPREKIRIVLADSLDDTNGYSTQQPWNTIRIFAALPHSEDRLDYYDDWMRTIITHEMTHAIHIDSVRAIPAGLRFVFGRAFFLQHIQPVFMIEGLAVHEETDLTTKGRNRSTTSDMIIRAAALEGRFPGLDRASFFPRTWPGGAVPYIFGGEFHEYLANRFGDDTLGDYAWKHAGQIWPFLFDTNAKSTFAHHTLDELWSDWRYEATFAYQAQYRVLVEEGLTATRALTDSGFQHGRPRFLDNDTVLVETNDGRRKGRIEAIDLPSGQSRTVEGAGILRGMAVVPGTRKIVYASAGPDNPWTTHHDLYIHDPDKLIDRRLTRGERVRDPDVHPDGTWVVAIAQKDAASKIVRVDLETGELADLTSFDRFTHPVHLSEPAFSPDGETIALSVWHEDGNRDIFLFDWRSGAFERVTDASSRDVDPVFSPDGKTLYFVSDASGIHNVYALDLASRRLARVTNVVNGAFYPTPSPDGKRLAMIQYSARGFDLHVMNLADADGRGEGVVRPRSNAIRPGGVTAGLEDRARESDPAIELYSPWSTLRPSYWMPNYSLAWFGERTISSLGLQTSGIDSIGRHSYAVDLNYRFERGFLSGAVAYAYDRFRPTLRASASRIGLDYGNIAEDETGDTHNFFLLRNAAAAGASYLFTDEFSVFGNFLVQYFERDTQIDEPRNRLPEEGIMSGPRAGVVFSNAEGYQLSVAPENGGVYIASVAADNRVFGSEYDVASAILALRQFVSIPWRNNVLDLRLFAGAAQGDELYRTPFRIGGYTQEDLTAQTATNTFFLRGFAPGDLRGERAAVGSIDYRAPLWYQQTGFSTQPIYFDTLSASVYANAGKAWMGELDVNDPGEIYEAYGFELIQSLGLAYYYNVALRFVYAHAPDRKNPDVFFFGVGGLF